jgi:ankyrin repeat protein
MVLFGGLDDEGFHFKQTPELVSALLAHGAKVNVLDEFGRSPLFNALCVDNKKRIARLLIEHGANVNEDSSGWSLLGLEIYTSQDASLTELMLQYGAEVNSTGNQDPNTPMAEAVLAEDPADVRILLRHQANPNTPIMLPDGTKFRCLEYAEKRHLTEIAKLLRDAGARR